MKKGRKIFLILASILIILCSIGLIYVNTAKQKSSDNKVESKEAKLEEKQVDGAIVRITDVYSVAHKKDDGSGYLVEWFYDINCSYMWGDEQRVGTITNKIKEKEFKNLPSDKKLRKIGGILKGAEFEGDTIKLVADSYGKIRKRGH